MARPPIRPPFTPANWYWFVAGDQTRAFSSASGDYVPAADPTFQAWLAAGNNPTNIDSETSLGGVTNLPRPVNANVLAAYQAAKASAVDQVIFRMLFDHENRIRALASQAPVTVQQFLNFIASKL
jgi:hypothetical protein